MIDTSYNDNDSTYTMIIIICIDKVVYIYFWHYSKQLNSAKIILFKKCKVKFKNIFHFILDSIKQILHGRARSARLPSYCTNFKICSTHV